MEYIVFLAGTVVCILLLYVKGIYDEKKKRIWLKDKLKKASGQASDYRIDYDALFHVKRYFEKHKETYQIDDITWNDLSMDQVFAEMNFTKSSCGEEYLYYRLRTPAFDKTELEEFEKKIAYISQNEEMRLDAQLAFMKLGKLGKYSLYDYLDHLDALGEINNLSMLLWDAALLVAIAVMFISLPIGLLLLIGVITHNIITYFQKHKKIEPYITSFAYIFRMLSAGRDICKVFSSDEVFGEECSVLDECFKEMRDFDRGSFLVMNARTGTGSSNPLEILIDYLCMVLSLDLLKFNQMLSIVRKRTALIEKSLTVMGYLECVVSIVLYRDQLANGYCIPVFCSDEFEMKGLYHPLIEKPVKNTLTIDSNILLTGSNASGKSTFLKAVALNMILAQTIHTCLADGYRAGFYYPMSSMNLSDSVEAGDSYYMAEIKAIKRIFACKAEKNDDNFEIACFLDEVLRGTNTVERIAAATQILKELAASGVKCYAATHDIELSSLLKKDYEMYHFEETVEQNDISFSYELLEGKATTRNAIRLLALMGFDEALIQSAESRANVFLEEGKWV